MRLHRDERGGTLVFVLIFIMAFSVVVTAALGFASTALSANKQLSHQNREREAADAGAEYAIQRVKAALAAAFGSAPVTVGPPATVNGESVSVTVTQLSGTTLVILPAAAPCVPVSTTADFTASLSGGAALPFGAVWSVTPSGATVDQGGRFTAGAAPGTFTLQVTLANVSATKTVTVC